MAHQNKIEEQRLPKVPVEWFAEAEPPWMDQGDAAALLHTTHPRVVFLKTLPRSARVLDVGAGEGSLHVFRGWLLPGRTNLKIYAYALEKGSAFDSCDGFEIGRWPDQKPNFAGAGFDAIYASHFIEHIPEPIGFLEWAVTRLNPGGRIYCEWPSEHSLDQDRREAFHARDIPIMISHFHDDPTHQMSIPKRKHVVQALEAGGLLIDQEGFITNPFLETEALAHYKIGNPDMFMLQSAFWSRARWAQYVIATKL